MKKFEDAVAITKHPEGTATFLIRLRTKKGTQYQTMLSEPKPITEMLATLDEQAAAIRKYFLPEEDGSEAKRAGSDDVSFAPSAPNSLKKKASR